MTCVIAGFQDRCIQPLCHASKYFKFAGFSSGRAVALNLLRKLACTSAVAPLLGAKTGAFNHSATLPDNSSLPVSGHCQAEARSPPVGFAWWASAWKDMIIRLHCPAGRKKFQCAAFVSVMQLFRAPLAAGWDNIRATRVRIVRIVGIRVDCRCLRPHGQNRKSVRIA